MPSLERSEREAPSENQIEQDMIKPVHRQVHDNATSNLDLGNARADEEEKASAPPAKVSPAAPASTPVLSDMMERVMNKSQAAKKSPSMIS